MIVLPRPKYARITNLTKCVDETSADHQIWFTEASASACALLRTTQRLRNEKVLLVSVGAILAHDTAKRWKIDWHCDVFYDKSNQKMCRVKPLTLGAFTSLAALSLCASNDIALQEEYAQTKSCEMLRQACSKLLPISKVSAEPSLFVDLLANKTLLRTLMHVDVAVYLLPHIDEDTINRLILGDIEYVTAQRISKTKCNMKFVLDAHLLESDGEKCSLSAQQLERQSRRLVKSSFLTFLPILSSRERQTLAEFVKQSERKQQDTTNHANTRSKRTHQKPYLGDIGEEALLNFAQKLLRVVKRLAPNDSVGVLIRPYDLQATALVEQACPYMLQHVGAFVPRC